MGKWGGYWDSSKYIYNIRIAADNFKTIIGKYNIKDEDIIVISSDHGVLLDMDFIKDAIDRGERHYEQSVRTFFAIVGLGINKVFDHLISALDEGPTIVDIILDTQMYGQGRSRWELIEKNIYVPTYIYREKGTWCGEEIKRTPFKSNVFYLRDGKWKYVYGLDDSRCEWLIDLDQDKDYTFNRKDIEEKRVQEYRKLINDIFIDCNIPDSDFLKKLETNGKHRMPPFFSLILNYSSKPDEGTK